MAGSGPLQVEKKAAKRREKRKNQSARQNSRVERLKRLNPSKLWHQVQELERKEQQLDSEQKRRLLGLQRDLRDLQKISKWRPPVLTKVIPQESVFYHPIINPTGSPPPGYSQHRADEFESPETDDSTAEIPMPPEKPSKVPEVKAVYEAEAQVHLSATDFKPRTI